MEKSSTVLKSTEEVPSASGSESRMSEISFSMPVEVQDRSEANAVRRSSRVALSGISLADMEISSMVGDPSWQVWGVRSTMTHSSPVMV